MRKIGHRATGDREHKAKQAIICPHEKSKRWSLRDGLFMLAVTNEDSSDLIEREKATIAIRLDNLEEIELGHKPAGSA